MALKFCLTLFEVGFVSNWNRSQKNHTLNRMLGPLRKVSKTLLTLFKVGIVKMALKLCKTLFMVGFCEKMKRSQNPTLNKVLQSVRAFFTNPTINRVNRVLGPLRKDCKNLSTQLSLFKVRFVKKVLNSVKLCLR